MRRANSLEKTLDAGKDLRQEEKGMTEDQMVEWHHQLNEHEFEQAPEDGEGQGRLACCSPWGHKELDTTEWLNNSNPASLDSKETHATKLHLKQNWHMQLPLSGIVLKWTTCVSFSLSLLPSNWNVMPGAPAAILDHKMTMWLEAIMEKQWTRSWVPDTKKTAPAIPPYFLTMKNKYNFTLLNYYPLWHYNKDPLWSYSHIWPCDISMSASEPFCF